MIRVRSGWISREEAGLKAHDEVKRASSRINANASRVQYTPSCTTMCTERSRDPTTTGDDLVIRNNADAFSDNSSRINACQGFHCTAATATYKISSIFISFRFITVYSADTWFSSGVNTPLMKIQFGDCTYCQCTFTIYKSVEWAGHWTLKKSRTKQVTTTRVV